MSNSKKIIILIAILLLIMIIIICSIITLLKSEEEDNNIIYEDIETDGSEGDEFTDDIQKVEDANIFYSISFCIEKYYDNLYNEDLDNETLNEKKQNLYNTLSKKYIEENSINIDNILDKVEQIENQVVFTATKVETITAMDYQVYRVQGIIENLSNENTPLEDRFFIVSIDSNNATYDIEPLDKEEIDNLDKVQITTDIEPIEKNDDNSFTIINTGYNELLVKYIKYYQKLVNNDAERAYNLLDEEYKEKRFGSIDKFIEYIKLKQNTLQDITIQKYSTNTKDDYEEYIIVDTNNNYYIIEEYSVMDFKMKLDSYTIESQENIQKYNTLTDTNKVSANIRKIIEAINNKDYNYIYNKLNEEYKNNKFPNINQLINYINNNFYDVNLVGNGTAELEANVYIAKIQITSNKSEIKQVTILVRLLEGTDFEISFSE